MKFHVTIALILALLPNSVCVAALKTSRRMKQLNAQ
jgi:hypothetical protein